MPSIYGIRLAYCNSVIAEAIVEVVYEVVFSVVVDRKCSYGIFC